MKKNICAACLAFALILNAVPVNAQLKGNTLVDDVIKGILIEIGSDAARSLFRYLFSPNTEERNPVFTDNEYLVSISKQGNDLTYYGVKLNTRDSLTLRGVTITGNNQRTVYSWNNGDYRYQVAWQPNDPQVIRLQVFDGRGKELLNRLLYKTDS
jgi:hypothetical protein